VGGVGGRTRGGGVQVIGKHGAGKIEGWGGRRSVGVKKREEGGGEKDGDGGGGGMRGR